MTSPGKPASTGESDGYDHAAVEARWQARWRDRGTNHSDLEGGRQPWYALMMFPYPSAEGLHVGNLFAFTGNDIYGRFQRLQGHTVFEPIGYDAFGIHSENYALKAGGHPMRLIPRNVANFRRQLERAGLMVDWRHTVDTTDPAYYKWTQWVFVQLMERGLAYRKKAAVNWCPSDRTVLANEQVIAGACERCGTPVEQRLLEQWFFRITDYAGRLLSNLDGLDWSDSTRAAQRNWIGRSEGAEVRFDVEVDPGAGAPAESILVYTTRPETVFGATYLVLAPEHPMVPRITAPGCAAAVEAYLRAAQRQDVVSRRIAREKSGVFTGSHVVNPATGAPIPVWIADYVLMDYGTGAIMAVPGHDERDFDFATAHALPIVRVVAADGEDAATPLPAALVAAGGRLVNSGPFDGMPADEAVNAVTGWLAAGAHAKAVVNYRLHDWCVSRQRYWGPPIPVIHCDDCGAQPVPVADLPVLLPDVDDYQPDDSGTSPLARHSEWYHVPCPRCGKQGRRETDVSDTFLDSAWYFLRYPSTGRDDVPFDAVLTRKWLPVHSYIGGNEHAVLHLLYARFITMVLHDMGHLDFEEPFTRFRAHGLINKDGAKMSKTRGNVVVPDRFIETWGADAFRTYLMFLGPFEEGGDFRDAGISGARRFLDRLWLAAREATDDGDRDPQVMRKLHQTIRKVGADIPRLSYNTAIAAMMEYMNTLRRGDRKPHRDEVAPVVRMVSPFAPHVAEELWERLGNASSVFDAGWPPYDEELAREESVQLAVQVNGRLRGTIIVHHGASRDEALAAALADPQVARFVTGPVRKVVFVPDRLLNLVV